MGDAHVATADDAFASFWNPAGLAANRQNSLVAAHHIWVGNTRTYGAAGKMAVGERAAVSAFLLAQDTGAGNVPGSNIQSVSTGAAIGVSAGVVRFGLAAKFLSERVITTPSTGFGLDLGIQSTFPNSSVSIGAALLNIGRMSKVAGIVTELPTMARIGVAVYPFRIVSFDDAGDLLNAHLVLEYSRILPEDRGRFHAGAAVQLFEILTVRAGYISNEDLRGPSGGLGLDASSFRFDYALVPFTQGFGGPGHEMSLIYYW